VNARVSKILGTLTGWREGNGIHKNPNPLPGNVKEFSLLQVKGLVRMESQKEGGLSVKRGRWTFMQV
jgi:hypothetical protein